jgi:hypothetical protein
MSTQSARILPGRLLFLLLALVVAFLLLSGRVDARQPLITVEHRVESGETLWDIAGSFTGPEEDVRDSVSLIRSLNELSTSTLRVGQVLLVPAG